MHYKRINKINKYIKEHHYTIIYNNKQINIEAKYKSTK